MSSLTILLVALGVTFALLVAGGIAGRTKKDNLEGWLVDHRGMGGLLLWFLLGSEIYTAFTFQGLAGYSYTKGAAGFYNVAQNDVAYAVGFLILPCIWVLGKKYGYVTQSDFVAHRYGSKALGIFVALCTALIMIAYIDLNIEGLSAIFRVIGGDAVSPILGNLLGFVVLAVAVFIGGIRGNAIQSVVKDLLMFALRDRARRSDCDDLGDIALPQCHTGSAPSHNGPHRIQSDPGAGLSADRRRPADHAGRPRTAGERATCRICVNCAAVSGDYHRRHILDPRHQGGHARWTAYRLGSRRGADAYRPRPNLWRQRRNDRPGSQHDRICGSKPGDLCLPRCNDTTIVHDTEGDRSGNG